MAKALRRGFGHSPKNTQARACMPLSTLHLLNPKSVGFDSVDDYYTVPSFKSFRSGVSCYHIHTNTPTYTPTHIVTN